MKECTECHYVGNEVILFLGQLFCLRCADVISKDLEDSYRKFEGEDLVE